MNDLVFNPEDAPMSPETGGRFLIGSDSFCSYQIRDRL